MKYVDFIHSIRSRGSTGPGKNMIWKWSVYGVLDTGREEHLLSGEVQGGEARANQAITQAKSELYHKFREG